MKLQWLNEFSDIGSEISQQESIKLAKVNSSYMALSSHSPDYRKISDDQLSPNKRQHKKHLLRRASSVNSINNNLTKNSDVLNTIDKFDFSIFKVTKMLGRENTLNLVGWKILENLDLIDIINEEKLACFMDKIYLAYSRDVQYHNDLHGADVAQMAYRILTKGYLAEILNLTKLDLLSFVIAALCHDVGHDGFNNSFHSNAFTKRAIDSNDVSVQETYHAAETFRCLNHDCSNFLENMNKEEFRLFRKRVIGMILATDMAKHASDLA